MTLTNSVTGKLFPNTPIEVKFEDGEWHIWVEGEWHSKEERLDGLRKQVANIIKLYGDDWCYPSTRVNPTWPGWAKISNADLISKFQR